jgi:hypothetical protein
MKWITDHNFNVGDGTAIGVGLLSLLQYLPYVSAALSVIWVSLRIWILIRDEIINKKD